MSLTCICMHVHDTCMLAHSNRSSTAATHIKRDFINLISSGYTCSLRGLLYIHLKSNQTKEYIPSACLLLPEDLQPPTELHLRETFIFRKLVCVVGWVSGLSSVLPRLDSRRPLFCLRHPAWLCPSFPCECRFKSCLLQMHRPNFQKYALTCWSP